MRETTVMARRGEIDDLNGVGVVDETIRPGIDGAVHGFLDAVPAEDGGDACMVCCI